MGSHSQHGAPNLPPEPGSVTDFVALVSETVGKHFKCCICLSTFNDPVMLPCNHAMCRPCALQALKQKQRCPECLNSIPNLRTAQGRNAWIADMVDSLRNCLNEVGASLTQHAPVPSMYQNARPLSPRELARVRAHERASVSDRAVPPSPEGPVCCGASGSRSTNAKRKGRGDGPERRSPESPQEARQPARPVSSRGRGRPRRETYRRRPQARPPHFRGRRANISSSSDIELPHPGVTIGRENVPQEPPVVAVVNSDERSSGASRPLVEPFVVGDLVSVASRTWPGMNKYGGVAIVKAVLDPPGSRYDVKYMITQTYERGVEACYVQPHAFESDPVGVRPRRGDRKTIGRSLGDDRSAVDSRPGQAAIASAPTATAIDTRTLLCPSASGLARENEIGRAVQHTSTMVAGCDRPRENRAEGLDRSPASEAGASSCGKRARPDVPRSDGIHLVGDDRATALELEGRRIDDGAAQEDIQCRTPMVGSEQDAAEKTRPATNEQDESARELCHSRMRGQSSLNAEETLAPCATAAVVIGRSRRRAEDPSIAALAEIRMKRARAEIGGVSSPSDQNPRGLAPRVPLADHESTIPLPSSRPEASSVQPTASVGSAVISPAPKDGDVAVTFPKGKAGTSVAVAVAPQESAVDPNRGESNALVAEMESPQTGTSSSGTCPPQLSHSAVAAASIHPEPMEVTTLALPAQSSPIVRPPATPSHVPQTTSAYKVGDVVTVQSQTSPGLNKEGGVARVTRAGPNGTYDVKYLVRQGTDKGVQPDLLSRYDIDGGGSGGAPACGGLGDPCGGNGTGEMGVARTATAPTTAAAGGAGGRPARRLQRSTKGNCPPDLAAGQANAVYLNILLGDTQHPEFELDSDLGESLDPTEGGPGVRGTRKAGRVETSSAATEHSATVTLRGGFKATSSPAGRKRKAGGKSAQQRQRSGEEDALDETKSATDADEKGDPSRGDGADGHVAVDGLTGKVDAHAASCNGGRRERRNPCDARDLGVHIERRSRSPRGAQPLIARQDTGVTPEGGGDTTGNQKPSQRSPSVSKHRGQPRSLVLTTSGLTSQMTALAGDLAKSHGWKVEAKYTEDVTHVVCRTAKGSNRAHIRSAKFLRAVAAGKWVLNEGWLEESKRRGTPVQEEDFEIAGDKKSDVPAAPRRSRIAHGEPDRLGLFHDTVFHFRGEFGTESPPRSELEPMLKANGGIVADTLRALIRRNDSATSSASRERRRRRVVLFQASPSAPERDARALAEEIMSLGRLTPALGGGGGACRGRGREVGIGGLDILRPLWLVDSIGSFRVLTPSDVHRVTLPGGETVT